MSKCTLVIMAAGIGSRFGGGIKQLEPVGPNGEIIMDYSIFDAIEAGFQKIVFIIRKDIEKDFKEIIGNRIAKKIDVDYSFQEVDNLPEGFAAVPNRTKPWGTVHAILSCKEIVKEPFAVINADDYYGKEAFIHLYNFLSHPSKQKDKQFSFCMAGFELGNTLSDNGTVTRGICETDASGKLIAVKETAGIGKCSEGAYTEEDGKRKILNTKSAVSMNMWGFTPDFMGELELRFRAFLEERGQELTSEFLIPCVIDDMLKEDMVQVEILNTSDIWFGVTYREDKDTVVSAIKALVQQGKYPSDLFL